MMTEEQTRTIFALWGISKLEDATRENWPFGHDIVDDDDHDKVVGWWPYMPCFDIDGHAAVKLAERVGDKYEWAMEFSRGYWSVYAPGYIDVTKGEAPTLGAALLAALEPSR